MLLVPALSALVVADTAFRPPSARPAAPSYVLPAVNRSPWNMLMNVIYPPPTRGYFSPPQQPCRNYCRGYDGANRCCDSLLPTNIVAPPVTKAPNVTTTENPFGHYGFCPFINTVACTYPRVGFPEKLLCTTDLNCARDKKCCFLGCLRKFVCLVPNYPGK